MLELNHNELVFRFPEVHPEAVCRVNFQRTLRIPDDNRKYPLPPGLGRFPVEHVEDHSSRLPAAWQEHGGVLLPMYQAEALWISFSCETGARSSTRYPFAVKVAAGKINAVTGDEWRNDLVKDPQDYLVIPDQPWLDGFCVQKGLIRQFVAMPLGQGYSAEEQISGHAEQGGIQIIVYPMKGERYRKLAETTPDLSGSSVFYCLVEPGEPASMGLAPGGLMRQEIYEDWHGYDAWDLSRSSRCFVHILNSSQWTAATGTSVPGKPPSAADYEKAGLPWFEYYNDQMGTLSGAKKLAGLDSVAARGVKLGETPLPQNAAVTPSSIVQLGPGAPKIADGKW